ncbi:uncharacterized protein K02A2.6 [Nephila pilipes]|uniref:RNA-directed DNA polymerase n=1 Tax=Nephila pilipes TaxID=299642 RepID=A0A8X6UFA5_NEPPI|nr:uncharacterized protein K02A2.6 [Nephila pilipes]
MTTDDPEMQDVLFHINNGWPEKRKTKIAAQPYWHYKEELYSTKERIICRGQRLVVPVKYRKEILKLLHVSHKGVVSSKIKAREYFYRPNLSRDVEEYVSKCKISQKFQRENQKEIHINPEIPGRPWQEVACDFFCLKGKEHLLIIDYLSKANGQIERAVQTVKNSLTKAADEEKDLYVVLFDYRIQPAKDMPSPAELLMGRKLKTFLPSHPGEDGGVFRGNRFHIRQDYTEDDNPCWSRTVEDLYNSDAIEISRIPNNSADSQVNASPKTNKNNINQQLQVPIENCSEQSIPVVRKSSRNIVKPVRYRDN